jgi:glycosyltransferase involved in cell wall biosynthesis
LWHSKALDSRQEISTTVPHFSVIIAVYNDWQPLDHCLRALAQQENSPDFEVIVVDDGSATFVPESIRLWSDHVPLTILRQRHSGVAAARNLGIESSTGSVLVFTDADCEMRCGCLSALHAAMLNFPQHNSFQLHLVSHCSSLMGRAEELRLLSLQNQALRPDGRIHYLNTAGFAIRKAYLSPAAPLFGPQALRAEDTLLLANLILRGELPLFVVDAIVQHTITLSWTECLLKDTRSAWSEGKTYKMIAAKRVAVRMGDRARMRMMISMWNATNQPSIGRTAWFVVIARRTIHRTVRLLYRALSRLRRLLRHSATVYSAERDSGQNGNATG